ncbi:hypothetical protein ABFU82_17665 [Nocardioides sp. WV_118_6]
MADAFWDLRDHAYDRPEAWEGVSPEDVFQAMAEVTERVVDTGGEIDWSTFPAAVAAVARRHTPRAAPPDSAADPDEVVRGLKITAINFVHDFIEVHMDDVILTGYTKPFGIIGCQGVGPSSITQLIGKKVEQLSIIEGEYVALDSGENRLAFPIGGESAKGPESVQLYRRAQDELGIPSTSWIW